MANFIDASDIDRYELIIALWRNVPLTFPWMPSLPDPTEQQIVKEMDSTFYFDYLYQKSIKVNFLRYVKDQY